MLLDPLLLWKMNISISSFIIWRCLLARYSSSLFLREFVILKCQFLYHELLPAAIKILVPSANCIISSSFVKLFSICSSISRYTLSAKNFIIFAYDFQNNSVLI